MGVPSLYVGAGKETQTPISWVEAKGTIFIPHLRLVGQDTRSQTSATSFQTKYAIVTHYPEIL